MPRVRLRIYSPPQPTTTMAMAAVASSPLRLEEIPGRGRAFVACRPIQAGEILLRDSPILVYPNLNSLINCSFCFHCFRSLSSSSPSSASASTYSPSPSPSPSCYTDSNCRDTFLPCLSCSLARFCSEACRSAALSSSHSPWPCHTLSALLHNASSSLLLLHNDNHSSSDLLTQAAFLVYSFNLSLHSPSAFSNLLSLQGTASASSDSDSRGVEMKKKDDDDEDKSIFLRSLISSISSEFASFSPQLVSALLAKDKLNAFGLMEPFAAGSGQRAVRAYAIYPRASFFNHDCLPNACRFDYVDAAAAEGNTDIIVRSIHDIMQGREVCLSYFPVNWGYKDRQRRLIYDYGFACHCDRCQVESRWKEEEEEEEVGGMDVDEAMDVDAAEEEEEYPGYLHEVEVEVDVDERDNGDFPHAYFFMSYVCEQDNCGGTLAPLPPPSSQGKPTNNVMECNVCGHLRVDELRGLTG